MGEHIGKAVTYTDEVSVKHCAIVTACHGPELGVNAINVVYVSSEADKRDQYGRQILRASSVSAKSEHTAHGRFYEVD